VQLNEQEYWQQIRGGDKKAYEQLFRQYYQALCNYAFSVIKDGVEAEEVVQNLFYNLWNRRETLEINISVKAYLYRAAHNDCLNRIKHAKVRTVYAEDYKSSVSGAYDDSLKTLHAKELNKKINSAIEELPEQCGLVFRLSRFDNLKYNEIAAQLDISVKTVENHMGKALKLMREKLKDYLPLVIGLIMIN
jgi:RNA polymerase sigma-70 factor (ECF subfamily)